MTPLKIKNKKIPLKLAPSHFAPKNLITTWPLRATGPLVPQMRDTHIARAWEGRKRPEFAWKSAKYATNRSKYAEKALKSVFFTLNRVFFAQNEPYFRKIRDFKKKSVILRTQKCERDSILKIRFPWFIKIINPKTATNTN